MKVFQLDEPELEFATGRHVDIRFGISNYGPFDRGHKKRPSQPLRAWNIFCALYYKAAGCAWRLPRPEGAIETETCYIGIIFYRSLDQTKYRTSLAQVFNERGIGMVVRGGQVETSQEDRQPHLDKTGAGELLAKALKTYKADHYHQPPRVVLYKTTRFNQDEIAGFTSVIESEDIAFADFLSVSRSLIRLYRDGYFPPLRGTCLEIDDTRFLIY